MMVEGAHTVDGKAGYCILVMEVLEIVRVGGSGLGRGLPGG